MRAPGTVPVDPGREEAQRLATRELADPSYEDEPPLTERVLTWVLDRLDDLLAGAGDLSPGRWLALLALAAVLALTTVAVLRRLRERPAGVEGSQSLFAATTRTAAEHLAAADAAAARGDWTAAVTERFRGAVRRLEERGVLDAVPGRTAEEVAREAGSRLPAAAAPLHDAAMRFDAVRYGGTEATPADDAALRDLVGVVTTGRPQEPGAATPALAVPR